jgi:hypothetical protein
MTTLLPDVNPSISTVKSLLSGSDFTVESEAPPDEDHFGNWILTATRPSLAIRVASDKDDMTLDLMPLHLFREGASKDYWFTWDVVAEAFNLKVYSAKSMLKRLLLRNSELENALSPTRLKKFALPALRDAEAKKRRRFMEGRSVGTKYGQIRRVRNIAGEVKVYVERRVDGRYAVRWSNAKRASAITDTQKQAIERARELNPGYPPHVERVRDMDKGGRDKWRKP